MRRIRSTKAKQNNLSKQEKNNNKKPLLSDKAFE